MDVSSNRQQQDLGTSATSFLVWAWPMLEMESLKKLVNFLLESTKELCMKIILGICLFFGYVVLSMIIYATMRHFLVPQKTHVLPVHLMFSSSCRDTLDRQHMEKKFVRPLDYESSDYPSVQKCSYPYAEFYLAEGQRLLSPGHVYTIAVEIDLPESQENGNIGMFMVNLTLYSFSETSVITSIRPTILHYKSFLLRTMSTIFYSFPLVLGLMEEKQKQIITMLDNYHEPYTEATVFARVTLLSSKIQVYNVELTLDAVFTGLSYYLYHWPISMTVIIVSGIFFTLSTLTLLMWIRRFIEKLDEFRHRRRHSSLRMTIRPSELDPIPEEEEQRRLPADNDSVQDVSTTDQRTSDSIETSSVISSVTEVTNTSDISELDNSLQNLKEGLDVEDEPGNSTPLITESDDSKDDDKLRHRKL